MPKKSYRLKYLWFGLIVFTSFISLFSYISVANQKIEIKKEIFKDKVECWSLPQDNISHFFRGLEKITGIKIGANGIEEFPFGNSVAFLVGVSKYKYLSPQLPFVENDLEELAHSLLVNNGFDKVYIIKNQAVTPTLIRDYLLNKFRKELNSNDRLLFYYSGHGADIGGDTGYMQFSTFKSLNDYDINNDVLNITDCEQWSKLIKIKHMLFIFDCCVSGLGFTPKGSETNRPPTCLSLSGNGSRTVITAGTGKENVYGSSDYSIFTKALLSTLNDDKLYQANNGFLTIGEIFDQIKRKVSQSKVNQTPNMWDLDEDKYWGNFVFIDTILQNVKLSEDDKQILHISDNVTTKGTVVGEFGIIRITSYLSGKVYIDDVAVGEIERGEEREYINQSVGAHTVKVVNGETIITKTLTVVKGELSCLNITSQSQKIAIPTVRIILSPTPTKKMALPIKIIPSPTSIIKWTSDSAKDNVVIGQLGDPETLNPILSKNFTEVQILDCVFSRLLRMNDKLQMEPELLTEMPTVSKDNLTYTFQLRKGVKFHDEVELTTVDVKFLYDMAMAPGNAIPYREMWEKITKFDIVDKYNFKITIKKPDAPWLENWCYTGWSIMPKHILEKEFKEGNNSLTKGGAFARNPIGSGPYRFVEWKTDQYIMLKKNPNYFIKGQPKIDTIVFKSIPDTNGLLAQFKNNEIDVFPGAQPSQYKELMDMKTKGANIQVFKNPNFTYMHADFNFNHPALKEKVVRQALCYAFPKLKFIDTVLEGIGTSADSNIVPMSWAYTSNVHKYEYDPEKAKKMLDEAGWKVGADGIRVKNGVKLAFTMTTNSGNKTREKFEEIAKQEWDAIGCKTSIQNYEAATLFSDILENFKFDIVIFAWISGADPDCLSLWHSTQIPTVANDKQGQNYVSYINPRMDTLLEQGQTEQNQAKRAKIYQEVQQILAEDVPYMFVYYYNEINAVNGSLQNFRPNATQASCLWNVGEWQF